MNWFIIVKSNYDARYYTIEQVKVFVIKNKISDEQYQDITGEPYQA